MFKKFKVKETEKKEVQTTCIHCTSWYITILSQHTKLLRKMINVSEEEPGSFILNSEHLFTSSYTSCVVPYSIK